MMFPVQKVALHKSGQAYFERVGTVTGTQTVSLDFVADEMDDVLRSLRVVDEGGRVESITYDTSSLISSVGRPPVFIPVDNSMGAVLSVMQGVNVRMVKENANITGRIMGLTTKPPPVPAGNAPFEKSDPYQMIDILAENQLISWSKDDIKSITILDEKLPASLSAYLDYAVALGDRHMRKVTVRCAGEGKRTVRFSYVTKHAVWKSSYRLSIYISLVYSSHEDVSLVVADMKPARESNESNNNNKPAEVDAFECTLEGWACVDNSSDAPWNDITLSLACGTPLSYSYDIYNPIHGLRASKFHLGFEQKYEQACTESKVKLIAGFQEVPQAFGVEPKKNPPGASASFGVSATPLMIDFTEENEIHNTTVAGQSSFGVEVSIAVNQAVLVPTVLGQMKGRKICWYSDKLKYLQLFLMPFLSVLFKNALGVVLDKGPVTVLLNNSYVGESLMDTYVSQRDEKILPYSAHLQVRVHQAPPREAWIPQKVEINKGRISGVQRLQRTTVYHIQNTTEETLDFALDHEIPVGWELLKAKVDQEIKLDKHTVRFFFKLPPLKTTLFKIQHKKENRTADVWIINMNTFTLAQLESLLTPEIGNKLVGFFESAREIYELRSSYINLKQQEDSILSEEYRIHTMLTATYADEHLRSNLSVKLTEYEDRLARIRESLTPTLENWRTKRSALLDSIEAMEAVVNFAEKDAPRERFKVPPLLPTMNIRQLLAEPAGVHVQDPIFRPGPFFGNYNGGHHGGQPPPPSWGPSGFGGFGGGAKGPTASPFGGVTTGAAGGTTQGVFGGGGTTAFGFGGAPTTTTAPIPAQFGAATTTAAAPFPAAHPSADTDVTWHAQPASQTTPPQTTSPFGAAFTSAASSSAAPSNANFTFSTPPPPASASFGSAPSPPATSLPPPTTFGFPSTSAFGSTPSMTTPSFTFSSTKPNPPPSSSGFGTTATGTSPFGSFSTATANNPPYAYTCPFGSVHHPAPPTTTSLFGATSTYSTPPLTFGSAAQHTSSPTTTSTFGAPAPPPNVSNSPFGTTAPSTSFSFSSTTPAPK